MIVEIRDLSVRVRRASGDLTLVRDLSYVVEAGECVAIVGESGAGKSIGIRAALGLLDPRRFSVTGSVRLDGVEVLGLPVAKQRQRVTSVASLVFQDPARSLNPTMRVGPQIAEAMLRGSGRKAGLGKAGFSKNEARKHSVELMREVGIAAADERYFAYPHELSGGMKQRIVIAIALACHPKVVFCDEPTSSLDVTTQASILDLLGELRRERSIATVIVTHDLSLAASRAQEVLVMYAGQVVERLPAQGIAAGARMPYTRALIDAVPDPGGQGRLPHPIEGMPPDPATPLRGCAFEARCDYAQADCASERPTLRELSSGHLARCWHPIPAGARS
jgi:oligopeptide/dipeptide ABC transporter ATP-binding protein